MPTVRLGTSTRTAAADAVVDQLDLGAGAATIQLRSGAIPATPQTAATGTLLATVVLSDPAAGNASAGVATIGDDASTFRSKFAAGDVGYARFLDSNNVVVMDMDVSTVAAGTGAIQLATTTISVGVTVDLSAITVTVPQG